ncbi:MAG: DNA repair protein rad2, partial [Paramarteilia canceri]
EIIQIFGIPVIQSRFEAEAQCCALEELGLCDATASQDSDCFLFGTKCLIYDFFNQKKLPKIFRTKEMRFTKEHYILFASITGSDYFSGIKGIGPKMATIILNEVKNQEL